MIMRKQAQQLENLVMEAEQEDFNKSIENLTKHCNAYVSCHSHFREQLDTFVMFLLHLLSPAIIGNVKYIYIVYVSCKGFLSCSVSQVYAAFSNFSCCDYFQVNKLNPLFSSCTIELRLKSKAVDNRCGFGYRFMTTARQLAVKLDASMVNDLGFSKRYVRCLQVLWLAEVLLYVIEFAPLIALLVYDGRFVIDGGGLCLILAIIPLHVLNIWPISLMRIVFYQTLLLFVDFRSCEQHEGFNLI